MRYVPGLIPENAKVLRDYFKGDVYQPKKPNPFFSFFGWVFGVIFFLGALAWLKHPILTLLYGALGFMLLPSGHRWLERKLRVRLTSKIKTIAGAVIFAGIIPFSLHYKEVDKIEAALLQAKIEQEQLEKTEAELREQQRIDSLNYFVQASKQLLDQHKSGEALAQLDLADAFALTQLDKDLINGERKVISLIKAVDLVKAGKYKAALPELDQLIGTLTDNPALFYNRAICHSRLGNIQEAVADCRAAIKLGSTDAEKLHDKINPVKKRIVGYVTRCCDGSSSNAKGRGACSRHGGVCDWNDPVYQEYRKY